MNTSGSLKQDKHLLVFSALLICLYSVGIAGHIVPATRQLMTGLTPWFLFITGALAFYLAIPESRKKTFIIWAALSFLVTFALESLGVATGAVFGSYVYGPVLGTHFFGVPPVIGFNWVLVILAFIDLAVRLPRGRIIGPVIAACAATGFDWIMEPAAIGLNYWTWAQGDIPLQNYLAWFLIALAASCAYSALNLRSRRPVALVLALIQVVFFLVLRLALFR